MSGSQTRVLADSVTISADVLDHCTIAPTCYLVPLAVRVVVTGAVFARLGCGLSFLWPSTALQWLYPVPGWVDGQLRDQTTLRTRQSSGVSVTPMSTQWCKVPVHSPAAVAPVLISQWRLLTITTTVTSTDPYAGKKERLTNKTRSQNEGKRNNNYKD